MRSLEIGPGPRPIGADVSLDICRQFGANIIGDMRDLPFKSQTFRHVYASNVLEHAPDTLGVLREWARVLKPGGILHIVVPHRTGNCSWAALDHYSAFTLFAFEHIYEHLWYGIPLQFLWGRLHITTTSGAQWRKILNSIMDPILNFNQRLSERFLWVLFGGIELIEVKLRKT